MYEIRSMTLELSLYTRKTQIVSRKQFFFGSLLYLGFGILATSSFAETNDDYARCHEFSAEELTGIEQANTNPAIGGRWGELIYWGHVAIHMANLPDGRILSWSGAEPNKFDGKQKRLFSAVWDPATGAREEFTIEGHNAFCSGQAILPDGRVLANGGVATQGTSIFNWKNDTWSQEYSMNGLRYYPTSVLLADGDVYTAMGAGSVKSLAERWNPTTGWVVQSGVDWGETVFADDKFPIAQYNEVNWWPQLSLAPNGKLFHAGPTPEMNWVDPAISGSIESTSAGHSDWYHKHAVQVMYEKGKILSAGGWLNGTDITSNNGAFTIDINGPAPEVVITQSMSIGRKFHVGVVLPTGEVTVIGGNTDGRKFSNNCAVFYNEIWTPPSSEQDGTWRPGASLSTDGPRTYHQTALLMTDARVISAGGRTDMNTAQIWSPPYLFNADGSEAERPSILSAPTTIRHEESFTLEASEPITHFSLIKMSSTTHAINTDLRYLTLAAQSSGINQYLLTPESNPNVLTPGYWMLFALNQAGVPSVAHVVRVPVMGNDDVSLPLPSTPISIVSNSGQRLVLNGRDVMMEDLTNPYDRDRLGLSEFYLRPGLADTRCYSFESTTQSGVHLRHGGFLIRGHKESIRNPSLYKLDATFCAVNGLNGSGVSFQSKNYPGRYLHVEEGGSVRIQPLADDVDYKNSATFSLQQFSVTNLKNHLDTRINIRQSENSSHVFAEKGGQLQLDEVSVSATESAVPSAEFIIRAGLYEAKADLCVSFESVTKPGYYIRHRGRKAYVESEADQLTEAKKAFFRRTSTFCERAQGSQANKGSRILQTITAGQPFLIAEGAGQQVRMEGTIDTATGLTFSVFEGLAFDIQFSSIDPELLNLVDSSPDQTGSFTEFDLAMPLSSLQFSWNFGDGNTTDFSSATSVQHTYLEPGYYTIVLTVLNSNGKKVYKTFRRLIHSPLTFNAPTASSTLAGEDSTGVERIWNVNPDNNSVSIVSKSTFIKELTVGKSPWSIAKAPLRDEVWVANKEDATLSVIDTFSTSVLTTIALPQGSQPHGIAFVPNSDTLYVVLEAKGEILTLDAATRTIEETFDIGGNVRHLSVTEDGSKLYVSRFITPPLPSEHTSYPVLEKNGKVYGGQVLVISTINGLQVENVTVLRHNPKGVSEHAGPGIPNYLGPAVISPDGISAWVPSKQDNILAGGLRGGQGITFDQTVRAITSKIILETDTEELASRIDHDDSGVATHAVFGPRGAYLFTALETSREVAITDVYSATELARIAVGRAPQGLQMSGDGKTLFVHNYLDRTISVIDVASVTERNDPEGAVILETYSIVGAESLSNKLLKGKQLFYDAADDRLAKDNYMSCASCHKEGEHDGRVWDLTSLGEGLRNTTTLVGKGNPIHGRLHWSGNFNEVQDFEAQIRNLAGGTGLMDDEVFYFGTRSTPLGKRKMGRSPDLDALAAYVMSLTVTPSSPYRPSTQGISDSAAIGKALFTTKNCVSCHKGGAFTDSASKLRHDVGTQKSSSGNRLGGALTGLDTPTLLGVWKTAPYLHDGSAKTLKAAIEAHVNVLEVTLLTQAELSDITSYLNELQSEAQIQQESLLTLALVSDPEKTILTVVSSAMEKMSASFYLRPGLIDSNCYSFESKYLSGYFLRHADTEFEVLIESNQGNFQENYQESATFCAEPGLSGVGTSLVSYNHPAHYLLVRSDNTIGIEERIDSETFNADGFNTDVFTKAATFDLKLSRVQHDALVMISLVNNADKTITHSDVEVWAKTINSTSGESEKFEASFYLRKGLKDTQCVSFESKDSPGNYLRHRRLQLHLDRIKKNELYLSDVTFCPEPGLNGLGVSFRSHNFPLHYLFVRSDGTMGINRVTDSDADQNSASFELKLLIP